MANLDTVAFNCEVRIDGISYSTSEEELYLTSEGIYPGSRVLKSLRIPMGDFIECLVDDHLVGLPKDLCQRIAVSL